MDCIHILYVGTQDVITCIKFGDDRLWGFWLVGSQTLPFPVDFAGRPYNSATLSLWSLNELVNGMN